MKIEFYLACPSIAAAIFCNESFYSVFSNFIPLPDKPVRRVMNTALLSIPWNIIPPRSIPQVLG